MELPPFLGFEFPQNWRLMSTTQSIHVTINNLCWIWDLLIWNGKWLQILGFYWRIWNKFVWNCPGKVISFNVTYRIITLDQFRLHYLFSSKFASKRWNLAPNFTIYHCAYYKGAECYIYGHSKFNFFHCDMRRIFGRMAFFIAGLFLV